MFPDSENNIKSIEVIVEKTINFLYVATVIASISINIYDIFRLIDLSESFILYTNIPSIFIILVSFLLKITDIISLKKSFSIVVCTILANSIVSIFQSRYLEDIVISLLRESIFIIIIISLSAFTVSRKLAYFITAVFCVSVVILYFVTKDSYILENIPVLILIFISYVVFINYLIYLINSTLPKLKYKDTIIKKQIEKIKTQNTGLDQFDMEIYKLREILKNKNNQLDQKDNELTVSLNEMKKLKETQDKLISVISKDIKEPMHAIIGFSKLLVNRSKNLDEKKKMKYAEIINNNINNLYYLFENLLSWSTLQQNSIPFHPEEIDINHIVSELVQTYQDVIKNKEIEITFSTEPNLLAYADKNTIQTIIRNLIVNSLKYSDFKGMIKITGSMNEQFITVRITDFSIGILKNSNNNIFELHDKSSLSGVYDEADRLGFSLSKKFIEQNNGKIWFENNEGYETTFILQLPKS